MKKKGRGESVQNCTYREQETLTENTEYTHIIIIIRHKLRLDRPVSALSNGLVRGLPSHLRPFGLQFSTIFPILLLFILITCHSQFNPLNLN
jgi:hypothetical protein